MPNVFQNFGKSLKASILGVMMFFKQHDIRMAPLAVILLILNGSLGLFYFMMRSRMADFFEYFVLSAIVGSVFVSVFWILRAPSSGWRARRAAASLSGQTLGGSKLPPQLQGPSEEKRQKNRAKRKKHR